MTLKTLPNRLSDATHAEMDARVHDTCIGLGVDTVDSNWVAGVLLTSIVGHSSDHLDSRFSNIENALVLLREEPDLMDLLRMAWEKKSFKNVRNLSPCCLQIPRNYIPHLNSRLFDPHHSNSAHRHHFRSSASFSRSRIPLLTLF